MYIPAIHWHSHLLSAVSFQVLCSYDLAHQHFIPVDVLLLFTRGSTNKLLTYMCEGSGRNN